MDNQNPWVVENIEAFNFYCCPECDFQSKDGDYFKRHAMESHKKSKVFFMMFENNINNDSVEAETDSESQVENKEGIVDFDPFETRSLSELELEEVVKFSENKNQDRSNSPDYISNRDLELFNKNETADNIEDDQEFEGNGENHENITDTETSDGETFDGIDKELECHNDHDVEITTTIDRLVTFDGTIDLEMETYYDHVEKTKNFDGQIIDENVTKVVTKNFADTDEEEDTIEIENQKIQDDHGSDPDFTAKSGSDSDFSTSTDPDTDEKRDQGEASVKKRKKIAKPMPCSKIRKTDKTPGRNGQSPMSLTQVTNRSDTPKSLKGFLPPLVEEQEQDNTVTMLKTNQGRDMVENSGFTYTFQKSLKGRKNMELTKNKNAWKCTKITSMKCPARIHTEQVDGVVVIVKRFRDHNHLGTIHLRRRQIFTTFNPYPPTIGIPAKCL